VKKGRVISQDPAAGSKLDSGSTVKVVISKGPKEAKVAVTNVVGKKYSDAKKVLKNAGLKVKRKGSSDGTVKSQNPAAGEMVAKGKTVTVKVEKKQDDKVKVPDVVGQSAQMAADTLDSMGLVPDMDGQIHGTVVKQNPKAGKKVKKGTKVKLDIDTSDFK
jgi:serine/threonine-protein kinase